MINDMIVIHNIAIRAINAIYLQSINIGTRGTPKDQTDFLEYCATWAVFIHGHHDEEEEYVFPDIEKLAGQVGLMGNNIEQHRAFERGLEAFKKYADDAKEGKEAYDGQKIREIIDSFMPALHKHLTQEIPTINGLKKFDDTVNWKQYWDEKSAQIIKKNQADPTSAVSIRCPPEASCRTDVRLPAHRDAFPHEPPRRERHAHNDRDREHENRKRNQLRRERSQQAERGGKEVEQERKRTAKGPDVVGEPVGVRDDGAHEFIAFFGFDWCWCGGVHGGWDERA